MHTISKRKARWNMSWDKFIRSLCPGTRIMNGRILIVHDNFSPWQWSVLTHSNRSIIKRRSIHAIHFDGMLALRQCWDWRYDGGVRSMYDMLYGVPPSMLMLTVCESEAAGVLPVNATDVPANLIIEIVQKGFKNTTYLQRPPQMSRLLEHWQNQAMLRIHHTNKAACRWSSSGGCHSKWSY